MELEKLNKCMSEMDTLSRVTFDYDNVSAEIRFNCYSGGQYEDVDLSLNLEDPLYYQLPFSIEGEFQVFEYSANEVKNIIPEEFYEPQLRTLGIKVNGKASGFYCCFSNIEWSVSGGGFIKNKHELVS